MVATTLAMLSCTATTAQAELLPGPTLTATGGTLHWTAIAGSSSYTVYAKREGTTAKTETHVGNVLEYTPPADPGFTDVYKAKSNLSKWSNAVKITWAKEEEPPPLETWEGFTAANPMPAARAPFSPTSFINTRITVKEVLSNSAEMVAFSGKWQDIWTDGGYDRPWYYASATDPLLEVSGVKYGVWANGLKLHIPGAAVPAPAPCWPGCTGDHHMAVIEPNGELFDFWAVTQASGGKLVAGGAGYASSFGTSSGVSEREDGSTASGFNNMTGAVRPEEWAAGHINHALAGPVHLTRSGCHIAPAKGSDGTSSSTSAPCQGQRFCLEYTNTEIEALAIAEAKETLLKAIDCEEYGYYVDDSGGGGMTVKLEGNDRTPFGLPNPFNAFLASEPEITKETGAGGPSDTLKLEGGWEPSRLRAIR